MSPDAVVWVYTPCFVSKFSFFGQLPKKCFGGGGNKRMLSPRFDDASPVHSSRTLNKLTCSWIDAETAAPWGRFLDPNPKLPAVWTGPADLSRFNSQKRNPSFWCFLTFNLWGFFHQVLEPLLVNSSDFSWKSLGNWNWSFQQIFQNSAPKNKKHTK